MTFKKKSKSRSRSRSGMSKMGRRHKTKIALLPTLGVGVALAAPITAAIRQGGSAQQIATNIVDYLSYNATGYAPVGNYKGTSGLANFYMPIGVGVGAHLILSKLGVNRALKGLPFTL